MRNLIILILPLLLLILILHAKDASSDSDGDEDISEESTPEEDEIDEEKLREGFKNLKYDKIDEDDMYIPKIERIEPTTIKKQASKNVVTEDLLDEGETNLDNIEHKRKYKKHSAAVSKKKQQKEKIKAKKLIQKHEKTRVSKSVETAEMNQRLKYLAVEGSDFKNYPKCTLMDIDILSTGFYHWVGWDQFLVNKSDEKYFTTIGYWFKDALKYFKLENKVNMTTKWDPRPNILNISWANWSHELGLLHIKFKNEEESSLEIFKENLVYRPDPDAKKIPDDYPFSMEA